MIKKTLADKNQSDLENKEDEYTGWYFKKHVKEHIQKAEKRLKTELKIVEEFTDSDGYDLSDKTEEWKSGFRRAMLLANNSINIYKYHKDKIFKECFGEKLI